MNSEWSPAPEDVERVARAMAILDGLDPDKELLAYEPYRFEFLGRAYVDPDSAPRQATWIFYRNAAGAALIELHARPIGWKPEQDVVFTDAETEDDSLPGTVDLSAITVKPGDRDDMQKWFENSGLS